MGIPVFTSAYKKQILFYDTILPHFKRTKRTKLKFFQKKISPLFQKAVHTGTREFIFQCLAGICLKPLGYITHVIIGFEPM